MFYFRRQIGEAIERLKRGKVFGQELELGESLRTLQRSASKGLDEVGSVPRPSDLESNNNVENIQSHLDDGSYFQKLMHEAAHSPMAALIILAGQIEKEAKQTLASIGKLGNRSHIPINRAIQVLDSHYGLPHHVSSSLRLFWDTRNKIIHGGATEEGSVLSAIDSGITILNSLRAIPREYNTVCNTKVPIYLDPECRVKAEDVTGIILESRSFSGAQTMYRIFPTTKTHFEIGKRVAWEWNMENTWNKAWYRDPLDKDRIKSAWDSSAEFIGRHLDNL